jgi:hypothetical protein
MMALTVLVVFILFALMVALLVFYFQTQQSLQSIKRRVDQLQPQIALRSSNVIRQERADHQDFLLLLEAQLNQSPRGALLEDEMGMVDKARDAIKLNNEELKRNGDWLGIPFDPEWAEYFDRLPTLKAHYARGIDKFSGSTSKH